MIVVDVNWTVTCAGGSLVVRRARDARQRAARAVRVVKELNGTPADVTPPGAAARESAFTQSYRAELAHFLAVVREEASYEPPTDQVVMHRIAEAIYKSADEEKEIRL